MKRFHSSSLTILSFICLVSPLLSQRAADPDPNRYAAAIKEFGQADSMELFPKGGIVFVGSSSIRRLIISKVFPGLKALNRGFGGSQISDVIHYIEETVLKYEPATVVMFCGGNDLWARKPALQVLEDLNEFSAKLFNRLPDCRLLVLAVRPSPRRKSILEAELAFNYLAEMAAYKDDRLTFLRGSCDRYIDDKGNYHQDLYHEDQLHMSDAGYQIWNEILSPYLQE